jgi:hypothetical protein
MHTRKECAENVLKVFTDVKHVKSTNWWLDFTSPADSATLDYNRYLSGCDYTTLSGPLKLILNSGIGNCDEKARLCWAGLYGNPRLSVANGHKCSLYYGTNYDHVFVIIHDIHRLIPPVANIGTFGKTAIIIDGWTEDWYFPNMDMGDLPLSKYWNFTSIPNPRQLYVRCNVASASVKLYNIQYV